jgi:hypothetical protein
MEHLSQLRFKPTNNLLALVCKLQPGRSGQKRQQEKSSLTVQGVPPMSCAQNDIIV